LDRASQSTSNLTRKGITVALISAAIAAIGVILTLVIAIVPPAEKESPDTPAILDLSKELAKQCEILKEMIRSQSVISGHYQLDALRQEARQGNPTAQFNLGEIYYFGRGVVKNNEAAAEWFRKAAEQGVAEAQYNLARMCKYGEGVGEDLGRCMLWLRRAADQGLAIAKYELG